MSIKVIRILLICFYFNQSFSQENYWFSYIDSTTNLVGYKDANNEVKITSKFISTFGINSKFKNIIPVIEKKDLKDLNNHNTNNYYLLKNGKKIGLDSVYIDADMTVDCEKEGKIRFRDKKTEKVGFFNSEGKVVIPAIYNEANAFVNGMALVLKNGEKKCFENKNEDCENWYWKADVVLINEDNRVIIDSLNISDILDIDWYSLRINQTGLNNTYKNFVTSKKEIYSFKILSKEFNTWLYDVLSNAVKDDDYINCLNDEIVVGKNVNWESEKKNEKRFDKYAWFIDSKENMIQKNKNKIKQVISNIFNDTYKVSISRGEQPLLIDELEDRQNYNTDCGYDSQLFPYFVIYIKSDVRKIVNYLGFLRIESGYKLIEIN